MMDYVEEAADRAPTDTGRIQGKPGFVRGSFARVRPGRWHLCVGTLSGVLGIVFGASAVTAQASPGNVDAGSLQRQADVLEPRVPPRQQADVGAVVLPGVTVEAVADVADDPNAPTLYLAGWRFRGNQLFDAAELGAVLDDLTGRRVSFAQVSRAARMIEAYYAENGYVARVSLPRQEVVGGRVLLHVQEARYAGVVFEGDPPTRVKPQVIKRVFSGNVQPGEPLRPEALDESLLIANGYYGVSLSGALAPGQNPGDTVLLLNGLDEAPYSAQFSFDNFGSRSIGEERASVQFGVNSPLRIGDLLLGRVTTTKDSPNIQLRYMLPVGVRGANVWADLGYMHYKVTRSELDDLDPKGRSFTGSVGTTVPLVIGRQKDLSLTLSYGRDNLRNEVRGDTVSDYHINRGSIGLDGSIYDTFGGGGVTSASLSYVHGSAKGRDAGQHFDDTFNVWRLNMGREQNVNDRTTMFATLSAQHGPRGLDSAEEFFLGGPYGVRAYPIGEGDGPSGAILNLEVKYRINQSWALSGFYDHGWVTDRTVPGEQDDYQLKGLGAKVSWSHPAGWMADLTLAHRLGRNPNAIDAPGDSSLDGKDQDGSRDKLRVWFEIRKMF